MPFQLGVATNPNGHPKGSRNKRTEELFNILEGRGDKDPIDYLSDVVTNGKDAVLRTQAANYLLPYKHSYFIFPIAKEFRRARRNYGGAEANVREAVFGSRGRPIRIGWNSTAATMVQASVRDNNLPMLDMPGWFDSHRDPKAVAVVMALKTTARVRLDCNSPVWPARHAMM
jgi:hypothetical protein